MRLLLLVAGVALLRRQREAEPDLAAEQEEDGQAPFGQGTPPPSPPSMGGSDTGANLVAWPSAAHYSTCGHQTLGAKFDLVVSFWTDRYQSDLKWVPPPAQVLANTTSAPEPPQSRAGKLLSLLAKHNGTDNDNDNVGIENFLDIAYELRTFERNGLLAHVRRVYVLMDEAVLQKHGAPRTLNFQQGGAGGLELKLITDAQIGIKWHERNPKLGALHRAPGILDWFMYVPDDGLMLSQFQLGDFWNAATQKPVMVGYGSWVFGWCNGGENTGSGHGPVLLNKCYLAKTEAYFSQPHVSPYSWQQNALRGMGYHNLDPTCLYVNAVRKAGLGSSAQMPPWFFECHTGLGGCSIPSLYAKVNTVRFLNFQGPGISDEKGGLVPEAKRFYQRVAGSQPMSLEKDGQNIRR